MERTPIVVGVDGSPASWDALHWAVGEAHRWRAPLEVLIVDEGHGASGVRTNESRLAQMVSDARQLDRAVRITGTVGHGHVVPALCEAARSARMVVVGHRGHHGFGRLLAGSLSGRIAENASVPVTVVHSDGTTSGPVVVGVDGSAGSDTALGVACDEAERRGTGVVAVLAYSHPVHPWLTNGLAPPSDPQLLHASACAALEATVAPWRRKYPALPVRTVTAAAQAVPFLTDLSRRAQLVVVGAHGHGNPTGSLGSVPEKLLSRAHCPVLIAR
jgi:nucleotide-binding universal stress UspA family protein